MKQFIAPLILLIALSIGCKKGDFTQQGPMEFGFTGLPDTAVLKQVDTIYIPIQVHYVVGQKEKISLQISGLPTSAGAAFSKEVDTPSFNTTIRLVTNHTPLGMYKISVTASSSRNSMSGSFWILVKPNPVNPARVLTGSYTENGPCAVSGNMHNSVTISEALPAFNKIKIAGLWSGNPATTLDADVDPIAQTISIPEQTASSATFSGYGTYSNGQILVKYKVVLNFLTDSCQTTLTK
ncbi:MAG: hypothetical protein JSS64_08285 [Bacteroidetes bacterium]|nr:hypothetical protein [Bacteroidota bacterium]